MNINLKRNHLIKSTILAATTAFAVCTYAGDEHADKTNKHADKTAKHSDKHDKVAMTPKEFIRAAVDANEVEVKVGQLAERKAENKQVKELGSALTREHQEVARQLERLAQKHEATREAGHQPAHQEQLTKLENASGAEFDKAFLKHVIRDHTRDLAMMRECQDKLSEAPELQALIREHTPMVQKHLDRAKELARSQGIEVEQEVAEANKSEKDQAAGTAAGAQEGKSDNTDPQPGDNEVLGLPTSNTDGTILGQVPAPSAAVEAGSNEAVIAEELKDGKVDAGVDNVKEANTDTVKVSPDASTEVILDTEKSE